MSACFFGHVQIVELLLRNGADLAVQDNVSRCDEQMTDFVLMPMFCDVHRMGTLPCILPTSEVTFQLLHSWNNTEPIALVETR